MIVLYNLLLYLISALVGNILGYFVITRVMKRVFRRSDFYRANLNMLFYLILAPSFTDPILFSKYLYFIIFIAFANTVMGLFF